MIALLMTHYVATLVMTGGLWLAQLSLYPLMSFVGKENFVRHEEEHIRRISRLAWIIIYVELITGALLVFFAPPGVSLFLRIVTFALIVLIWGVTFFIQFPIHKKLTKGFDPELHRKLVSSNWIRTIAWTLRAIIWTFVIGSLLAGI